MKKLVAWVGVLGYSLFFINPAGAVGKTQVESRALSLSDMPPGWSVESTSDTSSGIPCLKSIKSPTKHQEKASVAYKDGSLPAVQEVIAAGRGVSASYKKLNHALGNCKSFTYTTTTGGKKVTGHIGPLSFPNIGAHSSAYAINLNVQGVRAGADVVLFENGRYVGAVVYENIGVPDLSQTRAFVNEAVSKLDGKPLVVPTS